MTSSTSVNIDNANTTLLMMHDRMFEQFLGLTILAIRKGLPPSEMFVNQDIRHLKLCCPDILLVGRVKRAPHWGVQSRFRVIYIYIYVVGMSYVCRMSN